MTEEQRQIVAELSRCSFLPGSWDKRFVRDMASRDPEAPLTEKQAAALDRLAHRYRKQRAAHKGGK